jgi:DNA-binding FadR family transcriptional regulator
MANSQVCLTSIIPFPYSFGRLCALDLANPRRRKTNPVSVRVAQLILDAINRDEFPVGARLPSERILCERFEVSRPSLREALSALQFAGLAESRQGFGTVVISREAANSAFSGEIGLHSRVQLLEARLILEPEAIRVAAMDPEPEAMAQARTLLNGMWLAVESAGAVGADTDLNLHVALVEICRNRFVRTAALQLLLQARTNHWITVRSAAWTDPHTIEEWAIQHESTLNAIASGDPARASRTSRHHLLDMVELVLQRARLSRQDRSYLERLLTAFAARTATQ